MEANCSCKPILPQKKKRTMCGTWYAGCIVCVLGHNCTSMCCVCTVRTVYIYYENELRRNPCFIFYSPWTTAATKKYTNKYKQKLWKRSKRRYILILTRNDTIAEIIQYTTCIECNIVQKYKWAKVDLYHFICTCKKNVFLFLFCLSTAFFCALYLYNS